MMKERLRYFGAPPAMHTSLTVPQTESFPISPPGKYKFITAGKNGAVPEPGEGVVFKCGKQDGFDQF